MVTEPGQQKPARPVRATEDKNPAHDREEPVEENPGEISIEQILSGKPGGVVGNPDDPCRDEQPADNRDRERTFRQRRGLPFPPFFMYDGSSLKK
jgi:hypothetical protein